MTTEEDALAIAKFEVIFEAMKSYYETIPDPKPDKGAFKHGFFAGAAWMEDPTIDDLANKAEEHE